jgi:type II secretory pathway component PulF
MDPNDLIALNEEIAGMARAGLPLDQGLAALAREMGKGRLRSVTEALAKDLQAGQSLPEALARQRGRLPPFYAGLVAAGMRTGRISEVLATLTLYARSLVSLRTLIADALFYPTIVLIFAVGLFGFFCLVVLPQFDQIFRDFELRLPLLTELILSLGRHPLQRVVFPALAAGLGALLLYGHMRFREPGHFLWAQVLYSLPLVGTLMRSARLAAFSELLAILVDHQVPLPEAFLLAGQASSDPIMAAEAQHIHEELSQGLSLGTVLKGRGLVPEWVSWMTGVGEQRGSLGQTLHLIAEMYRRQVEMRAALLRSVLPPLLVIATAGTMTILFVFTVILPIMTLLEFLSK